MVERGTCCYRTGNLLEIDIRAGECYRSFHLGSSGSILILYVNDHVFHAGFSGSKIDSIPLGGTCFLGMTCLPVVIDIGLTSLTFAYVFVTSVEVYIPRYFGYQIDVLYAFHTLEHVLLVHHDLFLTRGEFVSSITGTVGRQFERHLDGNGSVAGTCVAVGELRLILAERIHLRYLNAEIMSSCAQRLDSVCYAQISPNDAGARDNRYQRLSHFLYLDRYRCLHILDTEIEFIGLHRSDHAARNSVDH